MLTPPRDLINCIESNVDGRYTQMVGEYINVEQRRLDKKYGILHSEGDEDNG